MGVEINLPPVSPQPHTHLAWEGFQYARERGKGTAYNDAVLEAFFVRGLDIGDVGVLTRLAGEVGLDEGEFRHDLQSRRYREAHRAALRQAHEMGVTAVPAFLIGRTMLTGLQGSQALERAIDAELRKQGGAACGPDGCPLP
jgi:predicted DsbA family dithiol-disulfide isomerase